MLKNYCLDDMSPIFSIIYDGYSVQNLEIFLLLYAETTLVSNESKEV